MDGKRRRTAAHEVAGPAETEVGREPQPRVPLDQNLGGDPQLKPGQRSAEAGVRALAEGQMGPQPRPPRAERVGVLAEVVIGLEQRTDHRGTEIIFEDKAGNFSDRTQGAIMLAIDRTARAARLNPDSWSIFLSFDSPGMTLYGDSLSAMVGLTVVALAKGDTIQFNRAMTGTVTNDGHIGVVSGIPFKIAAAHLGHMQRVLIPDEADATDPDWRVPFLMHVSPVGSVSDAYQALTDRPLVSESDAR